jgi:LPXTG-motif cell wall-anchored protein
MTNHVQHWGAFVGLGLGTELLALGLLFGFFKRRGWF